MLLERVRTLLARHAGILGETLSAIAEDRFRRDDGRPVHDFTPALFAVNPLEASMVQSAAGALFGGDRSAAFRFLIRRGLCAMLDEIEERESREFFHRLVRLYALTPWDLDEGEAHRLGVPDQEAERMKIAVGSAPFLPPGRDGSRPPAQVEDDWSGRRQEVNRPPRKFVACKRGNHGDCERTYRLGFLRFACSCACHLESEEA